ncbi:hypothetical protein [Streptomyces sp. NTH33]|nr:hypothetical protein [Streptomyces sp. NTH33]
MVRALRAHVWPALHTEAELDVARELMRAAVREGEDARDAAELAAG